VKARRQSRIAIDIWPWLVGLVAILLIPDVALRRLGPDGFARIVGRLWPSRWRRRPEAGPGTEEGA
jgi:hypothetical protein